MPWQLEHSLTASWKVQLYHDREEQERRIFVPAVFFLWKSVVVIEFL